MKKFFILKTLIAIILIGLSVNPSPGQDLDSLLNTASQTPERSVVEGFKGMRVGNGQSTNLPGDGELQMFIGHRFGKISGGFYEFFGLDQATMRMGFDYGFNNWLVAGFGRSTMEKTWDLHLKSKILGQRQGGSPVNFTIYVSSSLNTLKNIYPSGKDDFSDRLSISVQGPISRKFRRFSIQASPVYLHTFYDPRTAASVDIFSAGFASSLKLTRFIDLTAEYYATLMKPSFDTTNPFTLGVDIDTGGHLFQLVLTNAQAMYEKGLLSNTNGKWTSGDIYFGFNLVRTFYLKK